MPGHRFHLTLTERCNARCAHCYWDAAGVHADPGLDRVAQILSEFRRFARAHGERGRRILTLSGGEPTLRDDLKAVIRLARRRGFRVRLATNAMALDAARARSLRQAGLRMVQVSVDGAEPATFEQVRGPGSWAPTRAGIEALRDAGLFVILSLVLLPEANLEEAPRLLDLTRTLGVAGAKFARPVHAGEAARYDLAGAADYWDAYRRILAHAREIGYRRPLLLFDPLAHRLVARHPDLTRGLWGLDTALCRCERTELVEVNGATGDVYYCRLRQPLGSLDRDDLVGLWRTHPALEAIRRRSPAAACAACPAWAGCRGGCPAVTHGRTGVVANQDTDCPAVSAQGTPPATLPAGSYPRPARPSLPAAACRASRLLRSVAFYTVLRNRG
ncbi:MAG TPA: radical SAM protein [Acidobacteriota bacterium]|nr:radical SAM protein [Acidobacteriota bacterium]HQF87292.1 radical SAM protein [Acidobacteriota bacterium]HQG91866.1 radical SAM protein [Acidobacteriota bacterium]